MKHDQAAPTEVEPHVFDQTNGLVDLGSRPPGRTSGDDARDRTVSGIAMLSTQKP